MLSPQVDGVEIVLELAKSWRFLNEVVDLVARNCQQFGIDE